MKFLASLIFISFSLFCYTQTTLELKVFEKINQYRDSVGLSALFWDSLCYKSSKLQSLYLKGSETFGHSQNTKGLETFSKRYDSVGGNKNRKLLAEVCADYNKNFKYNDSLVEDKLASEIVNGWKKSSDHNMIITDPKFKFAAVSVQSQKTNTDIKTWFHYQTFSAMVLVDDN